MTGPVRGLVVAKAPVAGEVKTRLGTDIGYDVAARLAAAALLDTLDVMETVFPLGRRHLALAGDLDLAERGAEIRERLLTWSVHRQRGDGLGERLANAHADVAVSGPGGVVQVGMDTPHISRTELSAVVAALAGSAAVLGPAEDGGWWVLGLTDPAAARVLVDVPMSTERTGAATEAALVARGVPVVHVATLRDVDTVADADAVAALAPRTRFARLWRSRPGQ